MPVPVPAKARGMYVIAMQFHFNNISYFYSNVTGDKNYKFQPVVIPTWIIHQKGGWVRLSHIPR